MLYAQAELALSAGRGCRHAAASSRATAVPKPCQPCRARQPLQHTAPAIAARRARSAHPTQLPAHPYRQPPNRAVPHRAAASSRATAVPNPCQSRAARPSHSTSGGSEGGGDKGGGDGGGGDGGDGKARWRRRQRRGAAVAVAAAAADEMPRT